MTGTVDHVRHIALQVLVFKALLATLLVTAADASFLSDGDRTRWSPYATVGYDGMIHTYALSESDTTETISEFMVAFGCDGQSARSARNRWRLRGEASFGSELYRQQLEADYSLRDGTRNTRLRLEGSVWGRQYRETTDYTRSSDNYEGRGRVRLYPVVFDAAVLEMRGTTSFIDYRTPSTLEQDYQDLQGAVYLRSRSLEGAVWSLAGRIGSRAYPDTARIDRDTWAVLGEYDHQDLDGREIRCYHQSERRRIADETARPSAWSHWTELRGVVPAGAGFVLIEAQNEIWRYDQETAVYYDSWLVGGLVGYRWGDLLSTTWHAGLTGERLDAGDNPESYHQFGLQAGLESYGAAVSGSLTHWSTVGGCTAMGAWTTNCPTAPAVPSR